MGALPSSLVYICSPISGRPSHTMELENSQVGRRGHTPYPSGLGSFVALNLYSIYEIRRLVKSWYKRQETLEEAELKKLRAEQKKRVEEIKAKYNFDKIRALIEPQPDSLRREDPNGIRQRAITMDPSAPRAPSRQPNQRAKPSDPRSPPRLQVPSTMPPRPVQPPQRGWLDKVADKVLGEDESPIGIAQSRYALICERCFSHNGLVKESEWETTQYVCPKCGHMNHSPRAKKSGVPQTPLFPIPATPIAYTPISHTPISHTPIPHTPIAPTPITGPVPRISLSPVPDVSEPPSQDPPSQDQPGPDEMKMDLDSSSS
ncbi:unnamed protein product [Rhizoctonia solani]|uniref:Endoplasmic reticulum junction formation protein lunapark n=1 Tax=Rhizoctonia solani TaxID=456999 RepID=A0A8H3GX92_9AGAM|nr:unnamed protein product [Rhizoctonia solani]